MDTKNWTAITMIEPDDNTLRGYDAIIGTAFFNIYKQSRDLGIIRLQCFDRKRKDHLLVLRIALMARDIFQFPIEVDTIDGWWGRFCLNRKLRKHFDKVGKAPDFSITGVWVSEFLNVLRPEAIEKIGHGFEFEDIYNAYYEGSLN